jgi:hypothetical protein
MKRMLFGYPGDPGLDVRRFGCPVRHRRSEDPRDPAFRSLKLWGRQNSCLSPDESEERDPAIVSLEHSTHPYFVKGDDLVA